MTLSKPRFTPFAALLPALFLAALAWATPAHAADRLKVSLVPGVTHVQPGGPFYVAVRLQHKEGYHTYWKFPGIVGVPTSMDWKLPEGWKAEPLIWPAPIQVHMFKIRAQGYHGEVLLPVKLTPPAHIEGAEVEIVGKVSWMCCGRDCSPGFTDVSLRLPVKAAPPSPDSAWAPKIVAAQQSAPEPLKEWQTAAVREVGFITLTLTPQSEAAKTAGNQIKDVLFFTDDGLINADKDQPLTRTDDGRLILKLEISQYADDPDADRLNGLLRTGSAAGWTIRDRPAPAVSISVPIVGAGK
jgi:thiol:disulfide interchange protein DsbD